MAKFYGPVGYAETVETKPGVWTDQITERNYSGDVIKNSSRWFTSSNNVNDNLTINNQISILADPYAYQHFRKMKYVVFTGVKWKITNADVQYPRIVLTLGGEYNGTQA